MTGETVLLTVQYVKLCRADIASLSAMNARVFLLYEKALTVELTSD